MPTKRAPRIKITPRYAQVTRLPYGTGYLATLGNLQAHGDTEEGAQRALSALQVERSNAINALQGCARGHTHVNASAADDCDAGNDIHGIVKGVTRG